MYKKQVQEFEHTNIQEKSDKNLILEYIKLFGDKILYRENRLAHITSSAFIFNKNFTKTLMIHHNIYNSWGWTGGHADGDKNLLKIASKELMEETGVKKALPLTEDIITIDIIPVSPHIKNGKYINTHLHLNITYVFVVEENQKLSIKEDENSGVKWIPIEEIKKEVSEPEMIPIYNKIINKSKNLIYSEKHKY